jgi:hypothetical protein
MITANTSTAADDLGVTVWGNAAIEGALENNTHIIFAKSEQGNNCVNPAHEEHWGGDQLRCGLLLLVHRPRA